MTIHVEALTFDVIIGLLPHERLNKQTVIIDIKVVYEYEKQSFINYATLVTLVKEDLEQKSYTLLEDALLGVKASIIQDYPMIQVLTLKIAKPTILAECSVALSQEWHF